MPELPEVEITRRGLLPLVNQTVQRVEIRNASLRWPIPTDLPSILKNQTLISLERRAKYILARFAAPSHTPNSQSGTLLLHLGMSGRLCLLENNTPPEKHDHFDIHFADGRVMRLRDPRRFGAVLWMAGDVNQHALIAHLGPEPLANAFDTDYLHTQLAKRKAAIKIAMMDAQLVVGVGNIYASESLFRAGINPMLAANQLTKAQCQKLVVEIKATLQAALAAGGSTLRDFFGADGNPGYFQQTYFVYGRTNEACRQCATPIKTMRQGQRSTFYCPRCQR